MPGRKAGPVGRFVWPPRARPHLPLQAGAIGEMIVIVPSALAKNCRSGHARSFAASRNNADPRTERRSLLVNLDKQPTVIHGPDGRQIKFTYDSAGRLSTTTYPSVSGNVTVL